MSFPYFFFFIYLIIELFFFFLKPYYFSLWLSCSKSLEKERSEHCRVQSFTLTRWNNELLGLGIFVVAVIFSVTNSKCMKDLPNVHVHLLQLPIAEEHFWAFNSFHKEASKCSCIHINLPEIQFENFNISPIVLEHLKESKHLLFLDLAYWSTA